MSTVNGIRYDKLFAAVTTVKAYSDIHEKNFDAINAYLNHYVEKWGPKLRLWLHSLPRLHTLKNRKPMKPMAPKEGLN